MRQLLLLVALVLPSVVIATPTPTPTATPTSGWSYPTLLNINGTSDTEADRSPCIIVDSAGTLHAVWESDEDIGGTGADDSDILYAQNSGTGWSYPALVNSYGASDTGPDYAPYIVADRYGALHAVWSTAENVGGLIGEDGDVLYAKNDGSGWSAPVLVNATGTADTGWDGYAQLAISASGVLHAVWRSTEDIGGSGTDSKIVYAFDGGGGWSEPIVISDPSSYLHLQNYGAHIVVDGADVLHALWGNNQEEFPYYSNIEYASNDGAGWSSPHIVDMGYEPGHVYDPHLSLGPSGLLYAVWGSTNGFGGTSYDGDIYYASSNGTGWSSPSLVNTSGLTDEALDQAPELVQGSGGVLHVVWQSIGSGRSDYDIFYANKGDSGWSDPVLVNVNGADDQGWDYGCSLAIAPDGALHVAWHSNENLDGLTGLDYDIFYSFLPSASSPTTTPTATQTVTATLSATPTLTATATASPTQTGTASPSATATPSLLEIALEMGGHLFGEGDPCFLNLAVDNPGSPQDADLYVLLDVSGAYWCYPSWQPLDVGLDYEAITAPSGSSTLTLIPEFTMPAVSPIGPLYFYAALFESGYLDLEHLASNGAIYEFRLGE